MCEYKNDPYDLSSLDAAMTQADFVCSIAQSDLPCRSSLLNYLHAQPAPYFNYVLCVYDDHSCPYAVYVGYTNDLPSRMYTHAKHIEFDEVFIYHSPTKDIALANEQALVELLGTHALFNGTLAQMGLVSHHALIAAAIAQGGPPDIPWRNISAQGYVRKTYALTPTLIEALRYWCHMEELDLSQAVRLALAKGIQSEYLDAAYEKVGQSKGGKEVTA